MNMRLLLKLARFLKPYRGYVGFAFLAALCETAADLLQPWPLKFIFDHVFGSQPLSPAIARMVTTVFGPGYQGPLYLALGSVLVITLIGAAASYVQDFLMPRVGHWVLHDLRRELYWHVQRLSLPFHDRRRLGDLMATLTGDIHAVREMIESALLGLVVNTLTLVGMLVIIIAIDWRLALIALSVAPFLFIVIFHFTTRFRQASRDLRRREGEVASIAHEVLSSIRVVQAFSREPQEQSRFERHDRERVAVGIHARTLQATLKPIVELLIALGVVLMLWYGATQVLAGKLLPGSLLVFLAYLNRLYRPMRELSKQSDILNRSGVGLERIFGLLETERDVTDLPGAQPAPAFKGRIEFDHVSFAYDAGRPVLRNVHLVVEPGQLVAVVGSTGSGKTTLLSLLPRLIDPTGGCIRIDGADVKRYTLASLRGQISLVLQETVLFHGSVRDNIAYGRPDAISDEIVAAAITANADEFISRLPEGYDTVLGERGATLSGGQRQRLAIARAIVRNAPIVLLDEPTTGLDASSEALVMEGLARLLAGRTALIVAHRLRTITRADRIVVLEGGEVVETGTHEALLAAGGRYAHLYDLQFNDQIVDPALLIAKVP